MEPISWEESLVHCVHIAYPRIAGADFDLDHYLAVHVPLGVGLLWRHFGVKPDRVLLAHGTYGPDRTGASAPYDVVATMIFARKEDADRFIDVFQTPEAAALIQADWERFTKAQPIAVLGELRELDPDDLLARSDDVLTATSQ